jgi:hypothetical protein
VIDVGAGMPTALLPPPPPPVPVSAGFGAGVAGPPGPCGPTNGVAVVVRVTAGVDVTVAGGAGILAGTADLPVVCVAL